MNGEIPGPEMEKDQEEMGVKEEELAAQAPVKEPITEKLPIKEKTRPGEPVEEEKQGEGGEKEHFDKGKFKELLDLRLQYHRSEGPRPTWGDIVDKLLENRDLVAQALESDEYFPYALKTLNFVFTEGEDRFFIFGDYEEYERFEKYKKFAIPAIKNCLTRVGNNINEFHSWSRVDDWYEVESILERFKSAANLVRYGKGRDVEEFGLGVLTNNEQILIGRIKYDYRTDNHDLGDLEPLERLLTLPGLLEMSASKELSNVQQQALNFAKQKLSKLTDLGEYGVEGPERIGYILGKLQNRSAEAAAVISRIIERYGLDADKTLRMWRNTTRDVTFFVSRNLKTILSLEVQKPGITKALNQQFGIVSFGRYSTDLLTAQYEEMGRNLPYGVVLYPKHDWNAAFFGEKNLLDNLHEQLEDRYAIRVVEAGSKYEVARALVKLKNRYKHKISFALIGGHGTEDSIQFGGNDERHLLRTQDLAGRGVKRTAEFFEPNPTIILASCSTGASGGIGQQLSEVMGAKVIAPSKPTSVRKITADINDGLDFLVEYSGEDTERQYFRGKENR